MKYFVLPLILDSILGGIFGLKAPHDNGVPAFSIKEIKNLDLLNHLYYTQRTK
jgi:hypothetical protein